MLNSPATLDFSSFEGKENDPPSFNWIKKASARIPQFLVERHAMAVISVYLLCPQGEGEKGFKRDAWLRLRDLKKNERGSWIHDPALGVIWLLEYTWPVNPAHKEIDLKLPLLNLWYVKCSLKYMWRVNFS